MKILFLLICTIYTVHAISQNNNQQPCTSPEASQFDFWLGDWNLTWNDTLHGTNHVEKIMGGCTVQENFLDPKLNFAGKSWSVYNPNYKIWQQTWVDNQGGYIALTGGMENGKIILKTPERQTPKGKMQSRMVFYNMAKDSFDWNWEASTDSGNTWQLKWKIHYERKM